MSNILTYLMIGSVIALYLASLRRRRMAKLQAFPALANGARNGPIPGYSYLPGNLVKWDPNDTPPGLNDKWEVSSLETLHAGQRLRLVLTIRADRVETTERFSIMRMLARRLMERSRSTVVAVCIEGSDTSGDNEPDLLITARDGRGWTGTTADAPLTARLPDREPFRVT